MEGVFSSRVVSGGISDREVIAAEVLGVIIVGACRLKLVG